MKLMVCGKCHSVFEKSRTKGIKCPKKECKGILYPTDIESYPINKTFIDTCPSDYPTLISSSEPGYWIDSSTYELPKLRFPVYLAQEIPGIPKLISDLRDPVNMYTSGLFIDISRFLNINDDKSDNIYTFIKDYLIDYLEINDLYTALATNSIDLTLNILPCIRSAIMMDSFYSMLFELRAYPVINDNYPYKYISEHPSYLSIKYEKPKDVRYETYILAKGNILSQFYAWTNAILSQNFNIFTNEPHNLDQE